MLNFAHRGFSGKYPENTMLAFRKAVETGADGIELDVHFSKDKELIIIHDENLIRTCHVDGLVSDYTYDELLEFDASADFVGVYGVNKIPTLREYFDFMKENDIITNIELKTGINEYRGIEKAVIDLIKEYHYEDRIIISSFNHYSIQRAKFINPKLKYGLLEASWIVDFGEYAYSLGVNYIHPLYFTVTEETFKEISSFGIGINTWTVNSADEVRRLYKLGVNAVISNYPDIVKAEIEKLRLDF